MVEEPKDLVAVEKTGEYRGRYHVLQGAISPIEGVGPDGIGEIVGEVVAARRDLGSLPESVFVLVRRKCGGREPAMVRRDVTHVAQPRGEPT